MIELNRLCKLIRARNRVDAEISKVIDRPALVGHIGEFMAARVFDIALNPSASKKASGGFFRSGGLSGKSVNVKFYPKHDGALDIDLEARPDYYLVLTGPRMRANESGKAHRPITISSVFLFQCSELIAALWSRGVKIGPSTSVVKQLWYQAEIYPEARCAFYKVSETQKNILRTFCV